MSHFDQLHPALRHHIVNSLGWRELRPFQDAVIPSILAGEHSIVLAPTAGGKTEAAFFPLLSRMLAERWLPLSVLYVCPIKALLNNLDDRLQRYCTLLGRRSALWHGDVKTSQRKRLLREPPDCLLTTPESLEAMLVSRNVDTRRMFGELRAVVVDEIHAFAGDDRGWHLLSVLARISRLAGREVQRIGLSATVGNPDDLADWLAGSCLAPRRVFRPDDGPSAAADVKLDFVGSLHNAAVVISRLHRGEKRLVFVDSRARAEELGADLRQLDITTFVTHSSLSREQRQQAELAFASRSDCVIVATSALELGIDVGDLDRVIQIDSPPTVSSFLQRMGRTGRRAGGERNCLFLATRDDALLRAAGLIQLWTDGFVEPVRPPDQPYHILAQQLMALALQLGGVGRGEWFRWISEVPSFSAMPVERREQIVDWMLDQEILWDDAGILWFGRRGEETFGRKNFLELVSVFCSPPLFSVLHGRRELGYVDQTSFLQRSEGPRVILLGGRSWQVNHMDWRRRIAYVEATDAKGRSRWTGLCQGLGYELSQSIKQVLTGSQRAEWWSRRAAEQIEALRADHCWLDERSTIVLNASEWWTFGGAGANASLANGLAQFLGTQCLGTKVTSDSFRITLDGPVELEAIERCVQQMIASNIDELRPAIDPRALEGLKFSQCLPALLAQEMLATRLADPPATRRVLEQPIRFVVMDE